MLFTANIIFNNNEAAISFETFEAFNNLKEQQKRITVESFRQQFLNLDVMSFVTGEIKDNKLYQITFDVQNNEYQPLPCDHISDLGTKEQKRIIDLIAHNLHLDNVITKLH